MFLQYAKLLLYKYLHVYNLYYTEFPYFLNLNINL